MISLGSLKTYQVGGHVRDLLLGISSKDMDLAVEAPSFEVMEKEIAAAGYEIFLSKPEFAVVRARDPEDNQVYDFVLCRQDGSYTDYRHPDYIELGNIYEDLARRDFTVNAIAICNTTKRTIDPHGGVKDLEDRVLRCVGSTDRLKEDPLRILRALRFSITKGLKLHGSVHWALRDSSILELIHKVEPERIRQELTKSMQVDTSATLELICRYRLRDYLFNERTQTWLMPTNKSK